MFFKLKNIILVQCCYFYIFAAHTAWANDIRPYYGLLVPTSSFAAMSGAGAAAPGDASMVDANPGLLPALRTQYTVFGGGAWNNRIDAVELGIFDSVSTKMPAVLRVRETISSDSVSHDRRITLGIGYKFEKVKNLSIGISGDYEQISLTDRTKSKNSNGHAGIGAFYQMNLKNNVLFWGLSAKGLFDKYNSSIIDAGISFPALEGYYVFSGDVLFDTKKGLKNFITGITIAAQDFFDIKGSVGYNLKEARFFWGTGLFFNSPVFHLYYTLAQLDSNDTTLRQTAGLELAFSY